MKTPIGKFIVSSAIAIPLVFVALWFVALGREAGGCESNVVSEEWSSDRAYKATLIRKNCNLGAEISYSVRLDFAGSDSAIGWFVPGFELENDEDIADSPVVHWISDHKLEVMIRTETLSGQLSRKVGKTAALAALSHEDRIRLERLAALAEVMPEYLWPDIWLYGFDDVEQGIAADIAAAADIALGQTVSHEEVMERTSRTLQAYASHKRRNGQF